MSEPIIDYKSGNRIHREGKKLQIVSFSGFRGISTIKVEARLKTLTQSFPLKSLTVLAWFRVRSHLDIRLDYNVVKKKNPINPEPQKTQTNQPTKKTQ